ncbi:phage tail tape measure protein [Enterobacter sp. E76]|nr:phage tail tape measure protein [Enterobacter sp. E76]
MATLRELIIKISANSQSFQSEIARASRMGADYHRTMEQGGRRAAAATRESRRALAELNAQLATVRTAATGLAGAFAGAFATQELIRYVDTWNQLSGRLRLVSTDTLDFANSQRVLMEMSQRTGTSFEANASLYARVAQSMRDAGYASADVAKVTETVATALKLSGASTEEASSVITQLSQALASGVLRGEEFNAIMENGGRLVKLLASGMNTSVGGLREMAQNGELTTNKIVPLLTNVEQLRKEFETLPASISGSAQKVQNSFMAWVGGANDAVGASAALAGALEGLSKNIGNFASAAGVLVAVGGARVFGGMTSGIFSAASTLVDAKKNEIALANAQAYAATQAQRKAAANASAAKSAYNVALAEANVARGTNAAALTTDNLIRKRREMIAANAQLVLSNRAVTLSQDNLNKATSVVGLMRTGASGLLSLVGGIPGALMLGAGAWYMMYQNQEQARKSAQEYASQIDQIRDKTSKMSLPDTDSNRGKTVEALAEQNRLIAEQQSKIAGLKTQIDDLNAARNKPGITSDNDQNIIKAIAIVTSQLTVEEDRLNSMRDKSRSIQQALEEIERRRNDLIREQAWRQNAAYQSLLMMNGQHSEFNRLLSLGNQLIASRNSMASVPFAIPQVPVSDKDQQALLAKQQQAELAGLSGLAKVRKQADYDLQKMGRAGPENSAYAAKYRKAAEDEYNRAQNLAEAQKASASATREAEKAERSAAQTAEQYSRKIADLSIATEVQKVRATQGEKAADLFAASHENGTRWTDEQRRAIEASAVELAKWTQAADEAVRKQREMEDALKNLNDATRKYQDAAALTRDTAGMGDRQRDLYGEQQEVWRVFDKTDKGTQAIAARDTALSALEKKYQALAATESDWLSGASRGYETWLENTSDIAGTVASGVTSTLDGAMDNMSAMLVGSKANWKDWGLSVLQTIARVALQMSVVNAMGGGSSSSGWIGTIASGVAGYFGGGAGAASGSSGTALQSYGSTFQFNAKGGVYDSPSLSAYSNGVYNSPQLFAFAKGAGVFGEAGPEAIMPLTRAADGSLGVRAVGSGVNNIAGTGAAPQVYITIDSNGNTQTQASGGYEQFGRDVGNYIDRRYRELMGRDMAPGGAIWNLAKGAR